jgi:hypothetical protein
MRSWVAVADGSDGTGKVVTADGTSAEPIVATPRAASVL